MDTRAESLRRLRTAYRARDLTLYLGAGVSVGSGLPTWDQLVLAMYFSAISDQPMGGWRPFSNYLFAIAEWHLRRGAEPLEITARKIRKYYANQNDFLEAVRRTLYLGLEGFVDRDAVLDPDRLRFANPTLAAVASLCRDGAGAEGGARAVITYNYDNLLEAVLPTDSCLPVWKATSKATDRLPIYHVHGYVPYEGKGSDAEELIFTEDQYHLAAQDAYSWASLVQIQGMAGSVGLMIGLSLADRNLRRLLDAVQRAPIRTENYALLQRRKWPRPDADALEEIHQRAQRYLGRFAGGGVKHGAGVKGPAYQDQILGILEQVEALEDQQQQFVLEEMGVQPIWYEHHDEIPDLVAALVE